MNNETIRAYRRSVLERELRDLYARQLNTVFGYYRITVREFLMRTELRVLEFLYRLLKPAASKGDDV